MFIKLSEAFLETISQYLYQVSCCFGVSPTVLVIVVLSEHCLVTETVIMLLKNHLKKP
jgi:hypothetical protein